MILVEVKRLHERVDRVVQSAQRILMDHKSSGKPEPWDALDIYMSGWMFEKDAGLIKQLRHEFQRLQAARRPADAGEMTLLLGHVLEEEDLAYATSRQPVLRQA